ncbi:hypothetical protein PC119_g5360 [Phytophthora cactorum]|nr:hypothetical protein PC119_g5360 [Phytophthora cactorum]
MVKFSRSCANVGLVGSAFDVEIDDSEKVAELKDMIKAKNPHKLAEFDHANDLHLFVAKAKSGKWLDGAGAAAVTLDEFEQPHGSDGIVLKKVDPMLYIKNAKHFGENFQPGEGQVHVMVATSEQEQLQTSLWLVSGSIDNALDTKGIRWGKDIAFWYEDKSLRFHVQK